MEPGEIPREALAREIREELCIDIEIGEYLGRGWGRAGEEDVVIEVYAATQIGGCLQLREHSGCGWFKQDELNELSWVEPAREVLPAVRDRMQLLAGRAGAMKTGRQFRALRRRTLEQSVLCSAVPLKWFFATWAIQTELFQRALRFWNAIVTEILSTDEGA